MNKPDLNQSDPLVWEILNRGHCSFKIKTRTETFCRSEYNVTGLCRGGMCPLANSRYATVLEKEGRVYLYMKTAERCHLPAKMWERVLLSRHYETAIAQIDESLMYWRPKLVDRIKRRLTKILQMRKRMRKIEKEVQTQLEGKYRKKERRLRSREARALSVAQLEQTIEKELLERLKSNTYGDIYNEMDHQTFVKALTALSDAESDDSEIEDLQLHSDEEEELDDDADVDLDEDLDEDEDAGAREDVEEDVPEYEYEYEEEREDGPQLQLAYQRDSVSGRRAGGAASAAAATPAAAAAADFGDARGVKRSRSGAGRNGDGGKSPGNKSGASGATAAGPFKIDPTRFAF